MWNQVRYWGVGLFVLLIGVRPVAAQAVTDQEQPVIDASVGGFAVGGFYHQYLAQVFTAGVTASLVAIEVPLSCQPTGTVTVQIVTVANGVPTPTTLSATSVPADAFPSSWPDPPSLRRIYLGTPVALTAGQPYAFTLGADTDCGLFQGPEGDPYAGGDGYAIDDVNGGYGTAWYPLGSRVDLPFRTLVEVDSPKLSILHGGEQWICVNASALGGHLAHGDTTWFRGCAARR
jgi:hypothetical protein